MKKDYLPSREFMIKVGSIIIVIGVIFGVYKLISHFKNKNGDNTQIKVAVIGDLIQKDSNNNGIPNWEEYLWGLDPEKNGPENKAYILAKKQSLKDQGVAQDDVIMTDSDMLSIEFFAAIISLQQTGELDDASIKSISEAVGKNVELPEIPDVYTVETLNVIEDSIPNHKKYKDDIVKLIHNYTKYNIGSELTFIVEGLSHNDPQALYTAQTVGNAYKSFGKEFSKIPVPKSISSFHLSAANNYERVGESINGLTKIISDQITGMRSLIGYKEYSDKLASDLERISEILQ